MIRWTPTSKYARESIEEQIANDTDVLEMRKFIIATLEEEARKSKKEGHPWLNWFDVAEKKMLEWDAFLEGETEYFILRGTIWGGMYD